MQISRGGPICKDNGVYSPLQVLSSPFGWYIGRLFESDDATMNCVGSRESTFYKDKEGAERALLEGTFDRDTEEVLSLYS